jgi:hypothetical protein
VLALKENHRHLFEDVRDYFAWCQGQPGGLNRLSDDHALTSDWGHGHHEVRRCFCLQTTAEEWPQALRQWPGLQSVVMVERERRILPPEGVPAGSQVVPVVTRHYYLSSLAAEAPRLLHAIRAHWGIENSLHWVLGCPLGGSLLTKMGVAPTKTMRRRTSPRCANWRLTCCVRIAKPNVALKPGARWRVGMMTTCCASWLDHNSHAFALFKTRNRVQSSIAVY